MSSRFRMVVGFLSSDQNAQKSIITYDVDMNVIVEKVKELNKDFQILSTKTLSSTEALAVDHNRDKLFERIMDSEDLKRQLDHYRKPPRESAPVVIRKKIQSEEEAKPFKIGKSSMVSRIKSGIW